MNKKFHWFLISYRFGTRNGDHGNGSLANFIKTKNFTKADIDNLVNFVKKEMNCDNVVILSINYLGRMTKGKFNDE